MGLKTNTSRLGHGGSLGGSEGPALPALDPVTDVVIGSASPGALDIGWHDAISATPIGARVKLYDDSGALIDTLDYPPGAAGVVDSLTVSPGTYYFTVTNRGEPGVSGDSVAVASDAQVVMSAGEPATVFIDLAGTADTAITPTLLNACTKGAVPGTWVFGAAHHSGVDETATAYNHTLLRTETDDLVPAVACNGQTFSGVTRAVEWDQSAAVDPADWETIKWNPGETISGDFLVDAIFECSRSLGADTGGTSIDTCTIYYGGLFCVAQQKIPAGGGMLFRSHGGLAIPVENGVKYRVLNFANKTEQVSQLVLLTYPDGDFVGASENLVDFQPAPEDVLTFVLFGDYAVNGDGQGRYFGIQFKYGALAVLPTFTVPAVTGLAVAQNEAGVATLTWTSLALREKVERSSDGGASWSTLVASFSPTDADGNSTYDDSSVVDGTTYLYRVTPSVGANTGAASTTDPLTIDDAAFSETAFITGQTIGGNVDQTDPKGFAFTVGGSPINITQLALWGNPGQYSATLTVYIRNAAGTNLGAAVVNTPSGTGVAGAYNWGTLGTPVALSAGTQYFIVTEALAYNSVYVSTGVTSTGAGAVDGAAFGQPPTIDNAGANNSGPVNFKYTL